MKLGSILLLAMTLLLLYTAAAGAETHEPLDSQEEESVDTIRRKEEGVTSSTLAAGSGAAVHPPMAEPGLHLRGGDGDKDTAGRELKWRWRQGNGRMWKLSLIHI